MEPPIKEKSSIYQKIATWTNLLDAYYLAAKGKTRREEVARFRFSLAQEITQLHTELTNNTYCPRPYRSFTVFESKRRLIKAAAFRDRVVHHALCNQTSTLFEQHFLPNSYANRINKGTHAAIRDFSTCARKYRYCLRLDVVAYFETINHAILLTNLKTVIRCEQTLSLIKLIIDSGAKTNLKTTQKKGLPIGNLTSQLWANCYLHPLDLYIKRTLRAPAYLRYVDDFALFSNNKRELHNCRAAIIQFAEKLQLKLHENSAQVTPCQHGIPWLGMIIYPTHKRLKSRKVRYASRKLKLRFNAWQRGEISFAELNCHIKSWLNHAQHANSHGLIDHVLNDWIQR